MRRNDLANNRLQWPDGSTLNMQSDVNTTRENIENLHAGILKGSIAGIIIAKQDARSFADRKNPSQMRWQLTFVLRDSVTDFANVTCWGSETFIKDIAKSFRIGDAVEIKNVMVQNKQNTQAEEKFNPWTPSQFNIVANETHATIERCSIDEFASFAFIPVKKTYDYYKLGDIIANGQNLNCLHLNLLAVLRDSGSPKEITTKSGKTIQRRELLVFDDSCVSFPIVIWSEELSWLAEGWTPHETVLFFADVKAQYDDFRKRMVATCDGKTIITVNPDIPDAHLLYNYAQSIDVLDEEFMADPQSTTIPLGQITDVYTIEKVQQWINDKYNENDRFLHGIIYGCITNINIDSSNVEDKFFVQTCSACRRVVDRETGSCTNEKCYSIFQESTNDGKQQFNQQTTVKKMNIRVDISDHTGGMANFRLSGFIAEKLLEHNVDELLSLNPLERTELKWKYLMDRYKLYFKCTRKTDNNKQAYLEIISVSQFDGLTAQVV